MQILARFRLARHVLGSVAVAMAVGAIPASGAADGSAACFDLTAHGGGLNACGCHFNRTTGECHCHQARGCGCACQPAGCP